MSRKPAESAAPGIRRARRSGVVPASPVPAPLAPAFYARPCETVARELLGTHIISEVDGARVVGEIEEVEAYVGPHDAASHAWEKFGRTARNEMMFGAPGITYVYLIYGTHWCINVVTDEVDYPAAVLFRAARPVEGIETARERRPGRPDRELMRGPGNLARALGITGAQNGHPLQAPPLWLSAGRGVPDAEVATGPRIGIHRDRAAEWPLRFWIAGSPWVSKKS